LNVQKFKSSILLKGLLLVSLSSITAWLAFGESLDAHVSIYFLLATSLILQLLWATSEFALAGTSLILLVISVISVLGTAHGYGPFGPLPVDIGALELQAFLILVSAIALSQAAYLQENRRMGRQLAHSKEMIEKELRERTKHLVRAMHERVHVKEEIEHERDFSNTVLNTIGSIVVVLDSDGNLIRMNPACESITGYKIDELRGKKFWDVFFVPEEVQSMRDRFIRIRSGEYPIQYEGPCKTKSGDFRWIVWHNTCVKTNDQDVEWIIGTGLDLTERKVAEQEINKKDEQLDIALNAGKMGGWYWSLQSDSVQWFGSTQEILGVENLEVISTFRNVLDQVHPDDRFRVQRSMQESLFRDTDYQVQFRVVDGNQTDRWIQAYGRTLYRESDKIPIGMAGVIMDISERKRFEHEKLRLLDDAQKAIKQREEFIHVVSHELRTPLTPLKLHLSIFKRLLSNSEKKAVDQQRLVSIVNIADKQMNYLIRLVDTLLDISKIRFDRIRLNRTQVDLENIIQAALTYLESTSQISRDMILLEIEPHVIGHWDSPRIEQVVTSLVGNAAKYGLGNPIRISSCRVGSWVKLTVEDRGIGLAPEDQERIFKQFERAITSEKYGGFGLGLYISQEIVSAHQGSISVESQIGKGSTFIVNLPLSEILEEPATPSKTA
jgi:PAS domain S-box-containing protein